MDVEQDVEHLLRGEGVVLVKIPVLPSTVHLDAVPPETGDFDRGPALRRRRGGGVDGRDVHARDEGIVGGDLIVGGAAGTADRDGLPVGRKGDGRHVGQRDSRRHDGLRPLEARTRRRTLRWR